MKHKEADTMKKLSGNTIVNIVAAVLLLISLIIVQISFKTAQGWFDTGNNEIIIVLAVLGIAFFLAIVVLNITGAGAESKGVSLLKMFLSAGACACAGVVFGLVLGAIATEFAYTFLSDFNKGTAKANFMPAACKQAAAGMVLSVAAIIAAAAANAFNEQKR